MTAVLEQFRHGTFPGTFQFEVEIFGEFEIGKFIFRRDGETADANLPAGRLMFPPVPFEIGQCPGHGDAQGVVIHRPGRPLEPGLPDGQLLLLTAFFIGENGRGKRQGSQFVQNAIHFLRETIAGCPIRGQTGRSLILQETQAAGFPRQRDGLRDQLLRIGQSVDDRVAVAGHYRLAQNKTARDQVAPKNGSRQFVGTGVGQQRRRGGGRGGPDGQRAVDGFLFQVKMLPDDLFIQVRVADFGP